ncbi:uncharacterized protein LOC133177047 [Saccostrea echinata]|uniref:uncharacterized protein LOC133177047 n=1 Tax=Saccostrea echinata TaxID=191078 RepID=UPI002A830AC9|nr:uncharacterized protein LOC133177047 [Saccostrea echinata]
MLELDDGKIDTSLQVSSSTLSPEVSEPNSSEADSEEEDALSAPEIISKKTVGDKKKEPKRPCPFCMKLQSSLTKHIQRCHKNEEEVKAAMSLPGLERKRAFRNMKRQGIFKYNAHILKSKDINEESMKELLKERDQGTDKELAMCSLCKAFISKKLMYKHVRNCKVAEETTSPPTRVVLRVLQEQSYPQDYIQFLETFHKDEPGQIIRSDEFLKEFGHVEFQNWKGSTIKATEKLNTLRSKLRRLARLFINFKSMALESGIELKSCADMFKVGTAKLFSAAVQKMTNFDSEVDDLKCGLKVGLKSLIVEVCDTLYATYLIKREELLAKEVKEFQEVLKVYWKYFFITAREVLMNKMHSQSRAPTRLPSIEEYQRLRDFTKEKITEIVEDIYTPMNQGIFCNLRNLIACRLTLFNARRGGEATRLTISELEEAFSNKWADKTFFKKIDEDIEKLMCKIICAYLHSSKKLELVSVIIPDDCWKGLEMLKDVENRKLAGVHPKNKFIFANTENSLDHVNGWQSVHKVCKNAEMKKNITATDMRHYIATYYESLDVSPEERDFFIRKHLGHSKFINENIYQCPPAVRLMETAGKVLLTLDSYEGKNTDEKTELESNEVDGEFDSERANFLEEIGKAFHL